MAAKIGPCCHAGWVPRSADASCLVELVLSAGEFGPQAEPALRQLRAALEVDLTDAPAGGQILRTGMAVTQEFGKLDITVRALVSAGDLVEAATLGAEHLRAAIDAAQQPDGSFQEQSVRASWT